MKTPTLTYNLPRLDAAENIFFARELEQILTEQFDIKTAALKARILIPVDNSIDPGAETVTYSQFDTVGAAKRISDYSDDLPIVNVRGLQSTQRTQSYGAAFTYSLDEIAAAAMARRPLERMRAMAARKTLDQKLDDIAAVGDAVAGLKGLLTLTGTSTYTPITKAAGGLTWAAATADEILADLNGIVSSVVIATNEAERPTRIVLPTAQYELVMNRARSANSDTTILDYFLGNRRSVGQTMEVMSWERLAGAGAGGTNRMVAYDPTLMNLRLLMPIEYQQLPPEPRNMSFIVNCRMKTGGVISPYPKSISYADGI